MSYQARQGSRAGVPYAELYEGQNTSTRLEICGLPVPCVPGRVLGVGPLIPNQATPSKGRLVMS